MASDEATNRLAAAINRLAAALEGRASGIASELPVVEFDGTAKYQPTSNQAITPPNRRREDRPPPKDRDQVTFDEDP